MDNVCQRLGLQQPDLFGLRYVSRRSYPKIRWVDLDRPLKKQARRRKHSLFPYLFVNYFPFFFSFKFPAGQVRPGALPLSQRHVRMH